MSTVIAERALAIEGGDAEKSGLVRVFAPEDLGDCWRCEFQIDWPGFQRNGHAMGEDSYQALTLALRLVPIELEITEEYKAGRLRWLGGKLSETDDMLGGGSLTVLETSFGLEPYRLATERRR